MSETNELISAIAETQGDVPTNASEVVHTSQVTRTNGGKVEIEYHDSNVKQRYIDE